MGLRSTDVNRPTKRSELRELLIRSTAAAGRPTPDRGLEALVDAAPVEQLPRAAALHRVTGSVLDGLRDVGGVPAPVLETLSTHRRQSAAHHLVVVRALSTIAREWDRESIRWLVMKGPVAACLLHSNVGNRTYGDLDLLVAPQDLARAAAILEDLGYVHSIKDWALAERMMAGEFSMSGERVQVDLHWHVLYSRDDRRPFAIDPTAMFDRSRTVDISGLETPTFDDVDTLMMLAFHAARSGGHRLLWLKDIERSLAVEAVDLDELVRRSLTFRCAPPVGVLLARTRRVLGAEVPDETLAALMPRSLRIVERLATTSTDPIQLHERDTTTRLFTRSLKSSLTTSATHLPLRALRAVRRQIENPPPNETSDPLEKASYMQAVASTEHL